MANCGISDQGPLVKELSAQLSTGPDLMIFSFGFGSSANATMLQAIADAGIGSLMIEAGGKLAASLLREGMVDRILWTSSQHLIGADGIPSISSLATQELPPQASFCVIAEGGFGPDRFLMLERPHEID